MSGFHCSVHFECGIRTRCALRSGAEVAYRRSMQRQLRFRAPIYFEFGRAPDMAMIRTPTVMSRIALICTAIVLGLACSPKAGPFTPFVASANALGK